MSEVLLPPWVVARRFGVSTSTIYHWIAEGKLLAIRLGPRLLRVPEDELRRFIAAGRADVQESGAVLVENRSGKIQ